MEVMNRSELMQSDILVGQNSVTRSFGVSDDPMLMSMLSTGFYQNPHRTMIQEIMFNAWDAHRMGNCQDRPIDIYINKVSGLIIRDYGPGIDPGENDDNMHQIYCMYGGSTKRKQKNQTGGFGLGSKSPFAYTESFTVTSHFGGTKNIYLISRVSDSNGGKPGMTSLIRVPTTETGLMVTVPLKAGHHDRTYDLIIDILYLSGIKAMIHYLDQPDEFIDSKSLNAGEYEVKEESAGYKVYAVYGGVKYVIEDHQDYTTEYNFMCMLSNNRDIYIGFAPDSLSPLPNREGLNMGEKSKENVKATLELAAEKFQGIFEPLTKSLMTFIMNHSEIKGYDECLSFIYAAQFGFENNCDSFSEGLSQYMINNIPDGISMDVWLIGIDICIKQTKSLLKIVTPERWRIIFLKAYIKKFPKGSYIAFAALKKEIKDVFPLRIVNATKFFIDKLEAGNFLMDQMRFVREMKNRFPKDHTLHPKMRIHTRDGWVIPIQERTKANLQTTKYGNKNLNANDPKFIRKSSFQSLTDLYTPKDGESIDFLMLKKTVLIARTLGGLKNTILNGKIDIAMSLFRKNYSYCHSISIPVPAYVIHSRKGAYDTAMKILKDQGFTVIESSEPTKKGVVYKKKEKVLYPIINPKMSDDWSNITEHHQIDDPTHYYYSTKGDLKNCSYRDKPEHPLVYWFLKKNPKTVIIHNIKTAANLEQKGVVSLLNGLNKWYDSWSFNPDRLRNIIRASIISSESSLPDDLLKEPFIQIEMGMEPVDLNDEDFWYESAGLNFFIKSNWYDLAKLTKRISFDFENLWKHDPERKNIEKICKKSKILDYYQISSLWSACSSTNDKAIFVDKICKILNTL